MHPKVWERTQGLNTYMHACIHTCIHTYYKINTYHIYVCVYLIIVFIVAMRNYRYLRERERDVKVNRERTMCI